MISSYSEFSGDKYLSFREYIRNLDHVIFCSDDRMRNQTDMFLGKGSMDLIESKSKEIVSKFKNINLEDIDFCLSELSDDIPLEDNNISFRLFMENPRGTNHADYKYVGPQVRRDTYFTNCFNLVTNSPDWDVATKIFSMTIIERILRSFHHGGDGIGGIVDALKKDKRFSLEKSLNSKNLVENFHPSINVILSFFDVIDVRDLPKENFHIRIVKLIGGFGYCYPMDKMGTKYYNVSFSYVL